MHQDATKIATCCYCGKRTLLKLTARAGHELACGSCGAPLHEMKALKQAPRHEVKRSRPEPQPGRVMRERPVPRRKPKKKRKSGWKRAMDDVFDLAEDLFDIFD